MVTIYWGLVIARKVVDKPVSYRLWDTYRPAGGVQRRPHLGTSQHPSVALSYFVEFRRG